MDEILQKSEKARRLRLKNEQNGLTIPRNAKPVLQGYLYKQEVENSEAPPRVGRWERVFCVLYRSMLAFYRSKERAKERPTRPMDQLRLDGDVLVRKVKAASKSTKPSKYRHKEDKSKKELFLLTDLEHTNHYYATSSVDVKTKWVQKLLSVISIHQQEKLAASDNNRRARARKEHLRFSRSKPYAEKSPRYLGTGMSKTERRQLQGSNARLRKSREELKVLRDGWREEALRLRQKLANFKRGSLRQSERLERSEESIQKLVSELEIRGQEQELQAFETQEQRSEVARLKEKYYEYSSSEEFSEVSEASGTEEEGGELQNLREKLSDLKRHRKEREKISESFY